MKQPSKELVEAFFQWYRGDVHAQNEDCYAGQVTSESLGALPRTQFIEFFYEFAREGGKVQSGGHRKAPLLRSSIEAKYDEFRAFALEPFAEGFDESAWLERIKTFSGFGQGLATIYLNRVDKRRFAIVNNKAVDAVEMLGEQVPSALVNRYSVVRNAWKQLIEWYPEFENFYRADALSQFLVGETLGEKWKATLTGDGADCLRLRAFLEKVAKEKGLKKDQVADWFVDHEWNEFASRQENYEQLQGILKERPLDMSALAIALRDNNVVAGFSGTRARVKKFCEQADSRDLVVALIGSDGQKPAAKQIDDFIDKATASAFRDLNNQPVRHEAALFTSVLLTAAYPLDFVDFRNDRWSWAAKAFALPECPASGTYGELIVWAGDVARTIAHSSTFNLFFSRFDIEPLWMVAAFVYMARKDDQLRAWADELAGNAPPVVNATRRNWIYAPGDQARFWEQFETESVMGIGWGPVDQDLSTVTKESDLRQIYDAAYGSRANDQDFHQLCDFVLNVKEGDRVFVKRGRGELIGYGEVTSGYYFDSNRDEYRHMRRTRWIKTGNWPLPEGIRFPIKTLTEIKDPERLKSLLSLMDEKSGTALFSEKAFQLLSALHEHPLLSFYTENAADFDKAIEAPLKRLMNTAAKTLPDSVTGGLETERRIFSRIQKNDYGRGGAWDFYWGAFYPKGGKRTAGPQLYVVISARSLCFGFFIGEYGVDARMRFAKNCAENATVLKRLLEPALSGNGLIFGEYDETDDPSLFPEGSVSLTWDKWLADPESHGFRAMIKLPPSEVVKMSEAAVTDTVVKTFERLFALVLLAQHDVPLEPLRQYLGAETPADEEKNPVYTLEKLVSDVYMEHAEVERWIRAIQRKKQAIFYGPPGTGKTYVAQLIAQHLIGGGDGFAEVLQFHPSYAYEDFMQGLRPKALKGGGLEYAMVPGRFKDFCERARECKGTCVLVLDEINRANLARVFGELMYLLEYRAESVPLAGGERFQIPDNALIIGTMNTADRSIALVDHALRRRFAFLALYPNYDVLRKFHDGRDFNPDGLIGVLERLNAAIVDRHYAVGVSFFLDLDIRQKIQDVWQMEIEPYIEELFFDQPDKATVFAWDNVQSAILAP